MKISVEANEGGQTTVKVDGEITVKSYRQLTSTIDQLAAQEPGPQHVTLDITGIEYVDSVGLGSFLKMFHSLKKIGAQFSIRGATEPVRESMALTRLDRLLNLE